MLRIVRNMLPGEIVVRTNTGCHKAAPNPAFVVSPRPLRLQQKVRLSLLQPLAIP